MVEAVGEEAPRVGINRSPLIRIVVLPTPDRVFLLTEFCPEVVPVPVNAQSLTPRSSRRGEAFDLAMFDLGDETARAEREDLDPDTSKDAKAAVRETPGREGSGNRFDFRGGSACQEGS